MSSTWMADAFHQLEEDSEYDKELEEPESKVSPKKDINYIYYAFAVVLIVFVIIIVIVIIVSLVKLNRKYAKRRKREQEKLLALKKSKSKESTETPILIDNQIKKKSSRSLKTKKVKGKMAQKNGTKSGHHEHHEHHETALFENIQALKVGSMDTPPEEPLILFKRGDEKEIANLEATHKRETTSNLTKAELTTPQTTTSQSPIESSPPPGTTTDQEATKKTHEEPGVDTGLAVGAGHSDSVTSLSSLQDF